MKVAEIPKFIALRAIRVYQIVLSPFIGNQCRFHPSCSQYAMEAIDTHGVLRGSWLGAKRLGRCHPFHPGGFDPVPSGPLCQRVHDWHSDRPSKEI